jgi:hypothetical protein
MFMSIFPGTRRQARLGHAQAIVRRGEPVQFQWWVSIFEPQSNRNSPPLAERRALTGLRDDERMPVICPTCQRAFEALSVARDLSPVCSS